ncbi:MAG TPA: DUF1622 domain-containing protein [Pyrinomonadaceae bacterium]|jgi:uncharacterized membrane protein
MMWQESIQNIPDEGAFQIVEHSINAAAQWLKLGVEAAGALVIALGVISAIYHLVAHFQDEQSTNFNAVRLTLGKYLLLALEFQVGADILSTAIAPSWEQIGKLAAIVAIRTVLNYFLTQEIESEQKRVKRNEKSGNNQDETRIN